MSAQAKHDPSADAAQDAERSADLCELLGHVNARWDDERRALSRQLHDNTGSSLTALAMHLSLLAQQMPQERALGERIAQMKTLLNKVIESNRQIQETLWNDKLEFLGMNVALGELGARFGERHAVAVRCSLPEKEPAYPRNYGLTLLRALEEALSNIAAHAHASEVEIVVDDNGEALMLTVKDNGIGLADGALSLAGKHGLRVLRERLRYLGGSLTLSGNGGTTLTATLPAPAATPA